MRPRYTEFVRTPRGWTAYEWESLPDQIAARGAIGVFFFYVPACVVIYWLLFSHMDVGAYTVRCVIAYFALTIGFIAAKLAWIILWAIFDFAKGFLELMLDLAIFVCRIPVMGWQMWKSIRRFFGSKTTYNEFVDLDDMDTRDRQNRHNIPMGPYD